MYVILEAESTLNLGVVFTLMEIGKLELPTISARTSVTEKEVRSELYEGVK